MINIPEYDILNEIVKLETGFCLVSFDYATDMKFCKSSK